MNVYVGGILLSALLGWLWDHRPEDWPERLLRGAKSAAPYVGGALGGPTGAALGSYASLAHTGRSAYTTTQRPGLRQDFRNDPTAAGLGDMGIANDMDLNRQRMWHHMMMMMMANDQRQQLDQQAYNAHVDQRIDPWQ